MHIQWDTHQYRLHAGHKISISEFKSKSYTHFFLWLQIKSEIKNRYLEYPQISELNNMLQ